jgi:3-hydroxyacyl-CoA dehydrogenase / enoyl-CoA hydratase / 3-hydroxybutyryl-CoA epimerase
MAPNTSVERKGKNMSAFSYDLNKDGIAILIFDLPGEKVNKFTSSVIREFDEVLDSIAARSDIKALVIRSGKEGHFSAGENGAEIRDIRDAKTGEAFSRKGQALFAKLEALPFPTAAAIHGPCLGGGLELALACSYRIISNDQNTVLSMPEVKFGVIPCAGGTQRLPRLTGLLNALDIILSGKSVSWKQAIQIGLADEAASKELIVSRAIDHVQKAEGWPRRHGVRAKRPLFIRLLESTPLTRLIIYNSTTKNVLAKTRGHYPAPLAALRAIRTGLEEGATAGYRIETRLFGELAGAEISKNLISIFYLNKMLQRDPQPSTAKISRVGVIGAGAMGGGIAQLIAEKGFQVRMKDISTDYVAAGLRRAAEIFTKRRDNGILDPRQAREGLDRITGTTDYSGFHNVDLVIEAVVENMEVKKTVLGEFEQTANEIAVFASNTSCLPITEMAMASKRPELVVGMHFFNPVEKMLLVEVIRGAKTSNEAVSAIATLSRKLGKLPVIVNDGPGFLVTRILMPYLGEAVAMLEEGSMIEDIDTSLLQFGMPMGAFIMLDEIGIDIVKKITDILHRYYGERIQPSPLLEKLHGAGYYGKKNSKGFYRYSGRKRGRPDLTIYTHTGAGAGVRSRPEEIVDRALLQMIKESALCLEDRIIDRPDLLDAAIIFGLGFPTFRGGLLRYADKLGPRAIVEKLKEHEQKYGKRFTPPESLMVMAETGKGFYETGNLTSMA